MSSALNRLWATALLVVAPGLAAQAEGGTFRVVRQQDPESREHIERRLVEVLELLESDQPSEEERARVRASLRELVEHVRGEHSRSERRVHAKGGVTVVRPTEVELHADDVQVFEVERDGRAREAEEELRKRFRVLRAEAGAPEVVELEVDAAPEAPRAPRAARVLRRAKAPEAPEAERHGGGRGGVLGVRLEDGRRGEVRRLVELRAAQADEAREEARRGERAREDVDKLRVALREREAARAHGKGTDSADEAELRRMLDELRGEMQEVRELMQRIRTQAEADDTDRPRRRGAAGRMAR